MHSSGLLILNKPHGMASFKALQLLKRRFRWKKMGHAGTLDPLATGVLPICIGKATRLVPYLMERQKKYEALIRLGIETQTQDREGEITGVYSATEFPSPDKIEIVLKRFRGQIEQIPPMYSALRCQGRRLYELAREGKDIPRKPRCIQIHKLTCISYRYPFLSIDVTCGKGTYIRTLASDIGRDLGTGGHLWELKRTGVGEHNIDDALAWDKVMAMGREEIEKHIIPAGEILSFLPTVKVGHREREAMSNGRTFTLTSPCNEFPLDETSILRIHDREGEFLGLGGVVGSNADGIETEVHIKPSLVMIPA
ncbi:MAG: tRNA pseudouridine(55) synthase TruB [bacterium]